MLFLIFCQSFPVGLKVDYEILGIHNDKFPFKEISSWTIPKLPCMKFLYLKACEQILNKSILPYNFYNINPFMHTVAK